MSIYLIAAYGIFCVVPLGLAVSIAVRRRRVELRMNSQADTENPLETG